MNPNFADLPVDLRAEIAAEWSVLENEAGSYFDTLTSAGRWEIVTAFFATSPGAALGWYMATSDASTLRDLASLLMARSRALESAA